MKHEKLRCFKAKKKGFFSKNMKSYTKDRSKSYAKTKQIKKKSPGHLGVVTLGKPRQSRLNSEVLIKTKQNKNTEVSV